MNPAAQLLIIKQLSRHESCGPVPIIKQMSRHESCFQLAIIKQMSRHEYCGPEGDYQAAEQA